MGTAYRRIGGFLVGSAVALHVALSTPSADQRNAQKPLPQPTLPSAGDFELRQPGLALTLHWLERFPHQNANGIIRRRDGLLWFSSMEGLMRFDGYETHQFHEPWDAPNSRLWNWHHCMAEDSAGILWVGTSMGLLRFNDTTKTFIRYAADRRTSRTISPGPILALCADTRYVWAGSPAGLNRLNPSTGEVRQFHHDPRNPGSLPCDTVRSLLRSADGMLWVGTTRGLSRLNPETETFATYSKASPLPFRLPDNNVHLLFQDSEGRLWIATRGALTVFDFARGSGRTYPAGPGVPGRLPDSLVLSMGGDGLGNLLLGTGWHGLVRLAVEEGVFHPVSPEAYQPAPPPRPAGGSIWFEPRSSKIQSVPSVGWALSGGKLWQLSVSRPAVRYLSDPVSGSPIRFPGGLWRMALDSRNNLWGGQYTGGIIRIDLTQRRYTVFSPGPSSGLSGRGGPCFVSVDRGGDLWAWGQGMLHRFSLAKGRFEVVADSVAGFIETRDRRLWAVTFSPDTLPVIARLDPHSGVLTPFLRAPAPHEGRAAGGILTVKEDRLGDIWFGTFGEGVYRFSPRTGEYRHYTAKQDAPGTLKTATLGWIEEDPSGTIWVGTHSGLHHYDRESDAFIHHPMTGHESQNGHFIRGMVLDNTGSLWIGAGSVISRFDLSRRTFRDFSADDGVDLPAAASLVRDSSEGIIYAGTLQGRVGAFKPVEMPEAGSAPLSRVALTDFRVFEKPFPLEAPISHLKEITLTHEQDFFSFTFSALVFLGIENIGYAYKMEGFDKDWIETGPRAYASYTNLDPGDYVFHVRSTNIEGVWNLESTSIRLRILPPWWRTAWAYLAYSLLLGSSLFALWKYDRNRVRLRHQLQLKDYDTKKLLEIDQIKTRFFANISHEFRTPLTLILGPVEKLQEKLAGTDHAADLTMVRRNALRLLRLVNQILDLSRLDAGGMTLQASPTNIVAFLKPLVQSFSSMADRKRQTLLYDPEEDAIIVYVDRDKLEKAVTNLISNALKFTPEGGEIVVMLRVHTQDGNDVEATSPVAPRWAEIAVSDTGIGIPPDKHEKVFDRFYRIDDSRPHEQGGTGIGLALTRELVMLHRGEVLLRSTPGQGSTFTIRLPMGTAHLHQDEIVEHAVTPEGRITPVEIDIEASETDPRQASTSVEGTEAQLRPRVLIVEDSADVRSYLRGFLEHEYMIDEAGNGKEGLDKAVATMPDLMIADIMMPVMDGIEMCRALKTDERTSHIPVVMLTARAGETSKLEGLETGADDYLVKPFDARELRVRVRNLIDLRINLRDKYRKHVILEPTSVPITSADERFLRKLMETIESRMANPGLDTEALARECCMSRMQLNRKLQALTGHSTHEFLRQQRLQKAARLLAARTGNVTEVAYDVGFNSLSHFAKAFRELFGVSPSEYSAQQNPDAGSRRSEGLGRTDGQPHGNPMNDEGTV